MLAPRRNRHRGRRVGSNCHIEAVPLEQPHGIPVQAPVVVHAQHGGLGL